jgi:hypothetical protein
VSAAIEVLAIRRLDGKSTVKAFIDVQVGGFKIQGATITECGRAALAQRPSSTCY